MKVYTIIIIVVAFILLTNILFNKETFNVSFYNDSDVSNNQDTLYEKEVKQLNCN